MADEEFIKMKHKETGGVNTQTTRAAFDEVWQYKGWELVKETPKEAAKAALDTLAAGADETPEAPKKGA